MCDQIKIDSICLKTSVRKIREIMAGGGSGTLCSGGGRSGYPIHVKCGNLCVIPDSDRIGLPRVWSFAVHGENKALLERKTVLCDCISSEGDSTGGDRLCSDGSRTWKR